MTSATIKLFLPQGDPKRLRTAEISNWTGMAIAAPRTELEELLLRPETEKAGIYFLTGHDPGVDKTTVYIGEAEVLRERLKQHTGKDFWIQVTLFFSKDENLTKAHIRYLEGKLIAEAKEIGRAVVLNNQSSGAKLPESDQADMEVFLSRMRQLLPVLGLDLLTPVTTKIPVIQSAIAQDAPLLYHSIKGLTATGMRTPNGFVVFSGGQAALHEVKSASQLPYIRKLRNQLLDEGALVEEGDHLRLTKDVEFTSPSAAVDVLRGGSANGLILWHDAAGRTLKEIESTDQI